MCVLEIIPKEENVFGNRSRVSDRMSSEPGEMEEPENPDGPDEQEEPEVAYPPEELEEPDQTEDTTTAEPRVS